MHVFVISWNFYFVFVISQVSAKHWSWILPIHLSNQQHGLLSILTLQESRTHTCEYSQGTKGRAFLMLHLMQTRAAVSVSVQWFEMLHSLNLNRKLLISVVLSWWTQFFFLNVYFGKHCQRHRLPYIFLNTP